MTEAILRGAVYAKSRILDLMARAGTELSGFWRILAVGAVTLMIAMLGAFFSYQTAKLDRIEQSLNDLRLDVTRYHGESIGR